MIERVDLMPAEFLTGQVIHRRLLNWLAIGVATVGAAILVTVSFQKQVRDMETRIVPLRRNVESLAGLETRAAALAEKLESELERHGVVERLLYEPSWCGFFRDLAGAADGIVRIKDLVISSRRGGGEVEANQPSGAADIRITGQALSNLDVIRFIRKLSDSQHVVRLELQETKMPNVAGEASSIEFELRAVAR